VGVVADAKLGTAALVEGLRDRVPAITWDRDKIARLREDWWEGPITFKETPVDGVMKPQEMMRVFRQVMSDDDLFVSDASLASGWIGTRWQLRTAGRHFFAPRGLAGLGWGLPAAIGVSEAMRDAPPSSSNGDRAPRVVCLAGDGGWGYSMAEVETAVRERLPIIAVILNNSSLAWIKHSAEARYPGEMVSERFEDVSYAQAAKGLGAAVSSVSDLHQLEVALKTAFDDDAPRPWVIEATTCDVETPVLPSRSVSAVKGGY
jgi:acetolactate synthase-1/2/3 large subunit